MVQIYLSRISQVRLRISVRTYTAPIYMADVTDNLKEPFHHKLAKYFVKIYVAAVARADHKDKSMKYLHLNDILVSFLL